jgi:uncharacterized protein
VTMIRETVITSRAADGRVHVAPMGVTVLDDGYLIQPFRPSRTLDYVLETRCAALNFSDDVRIFAGCISGRKRDWPTLPATRLPTVRLDGALAHEEIEVERIEEDPVRPRLYCRAVHAETHAPFRGFNRAQAAVVEAAILVSRLHMLPPEKIDQEIAYLQIAITKTAGPAEEEAWRWMLEAIAAFRTRQP